MWDTIGYILLAVSSIMALVWFNPVAKALSLIEVKEDEARFTTKWMFLLWFSLMTIGMGILSKG